MSEIKKDGRMSPGNLLGAETMTFTAGHMMDNAGTASQHLPLVDDPVVQGAILRSFKQYIELNWACSSQDLIDGLEAHPNFNS